MSSGRIVLLAGLFGLAVGAPAFAHSLLLESTPAADATVAGSPPAITLRFNNRIEKRLSRIHLVDDLGTPRALDLDLGDGRPERLAAAVPPLSAGRYRVEWQVLSVDGHIVSGRFSFRIAP